MFYKHVPFSFNAFSFVHVAACTILVGLMEQLALVHNESIADGIAHFCRLLPTEIVTRACDSLVEVYAPVIIEM